MEWKGEGKDCDWKRKEYEKKMMRKEVEEERKKKEERKDQDGVSMQSPYYPSTL